MIVDPDFMDHWRTGMVSDALGDPLAPLYILRLWAHCQRSKKDRLSMDAAELAACCRFAGDPVALESALHEAGFLSRDAGSVLVVGVDRWLVRGRELDVTSGQWQEIRLAVFERDGYVCRYCGSDTEAPECDHILPLSRGGKSVMDNLATACLPCNRSKGAKTVAEWRGV